MFCMLKKKKTNSGYASKPNSDREKEIILLMIQNRERWHYLALKKVSTFFRGITSKHQCDFYCLNCLLSSATGSKLESHKNAFLKKDFCNVAMPSVDTKILKFNWYQKPDKAKLKIIVIIQGNKEVLRISYVI